MKYQHLPSGAMPKGSSPIFTKDSLPDALCSEHALAASQWGVLQVLEGTLTFVDLASGSQREVTAPDLVVIAPESPHKLRLRDGELSCRVEIFEEVAEGEVPRRPKEIGNDDAVRSSFRRCESAGDFAEKFYQVFLASSDEVGPLFAATDFDKQRKLLRASVYMLVTREVADPKSREMLERIGRSHARGELNIPPKLYELWLDSLCTTVQQMDPEWTEDVNKAWRSRMRLGIQVITAAY